MKKRGQPARPHLNWRTPAADHQQELDALAPDDPERDLMGDGEGLDFRLPPPPWDEYTKQEMLNNLARLRVDPNSSNYLSADLFLAREIANLDGDDSEATFHDLGGYLAKLVSRWDHETVNRHFKDILRMKKKAEENPHRNFLAYKAYCDFLTEYGFNPTLPRLIEFIKADASTYPVGITGDAGRKEWWDMFQEAGIARLAK